MNLELVNDSGIDIPITEDIALACLETVQTGEGVTFDLAELVYVDEDEIVEVNRHHMGRDYVTDIITFHYHDDGASTGLEGSLVMCAPRIAEQAAELGIPVETEFRRVLIHGLLHLCGYVDSDSGSKAIMTEKEDEYLAGHA